MAEESWMSAKLKVLIAEDDFMIADMTEELLVAHGYEVCGIGRTVKEAVALGRLHKPDLALIDYRLADNGLGTEVAAELLAIGKVGILYATGNNTQVAMLNADGDACLAKPYRSDELIRALEIVAGIVATGTVAPPFPRGFRLLSQENLKQAEASHG
jgi:DNA-binding response OmpR family regulator